MADLTGVVQVPVLLQPGVPFRLPLARIFGDAYTLYGRDASGITISVADYRLFPSSDSDTVESPLLPLLRASIGPVHQILPIGKNANNAGDNSLAFLVNDDLRNVAAATFELTLDLTTLGPHIPVRFVVLEGDFADGRIGSLGDNNVIYINQTGNSIGVIFGGAAHVILEDTIARGPALGIDFTVSGAPPAGLDGVAVSSPPTEKTVRVTLEAGVLIPSPGPLVYGEAIGYSVDLANVYPASAAPNASVLNISTFRDWVLGVSGGHGILSPREVSYAIPRWGSHRPVVCMLLLRFSISG